MNTKRAGGWGGYIIKHCKNKPTQKQLPQNIVTDFAQNIARKFQRHPYKAVEGLFGAHHAETWLNHKCFGLSVDILSSNPALVVFPLGIFEVISLK